ncbi:UDP-N-acetylmuramoyl-L-alanyl-D-glutamate--2,6-diaminopimelate ligase [Paenibacillus sp. VMFN-D1]|uniref:UDP-N-acetylmuramoyl-L-alanyl-D-glutamate--2, 6-diaminopimelate ligase n=1 Tax=Paenibacillus sp. VMFN-D1 TaxID=2135608 RepID=UPI000E26EF21|nr:UDP-N-acetylmuramoyl-L-alanyl-D-glutamate--2,6-diaminopimelate ligase [Paenibacillus sp. VMFN-D1]RED37382.1 UDP-N-acetylmuramoylalanyl-D-glutamate--2,6-diaminopimelate ligase [Paenibacillus sp. VMFN-D1]
MLLTQVIDGLAYELLQGAVDKEITGISSDSREIDKGGLFVAISGFSMDGHLFINKAVSNGASVVIVEKDEVWVDEQVTVLKVQDTRTALARVASNFYGNISEKMNLIGVTGTNGKTSITYFLQSIFEQAGRPLGVIGTMGTVIGKRRIYTKNTTPESNNLQKLFSEMVQSRVENCVMEVSSHGLSLNRVAYTHFNTGIFTNLTPDHLEFHHTMRDYFEAKAKLFGMTSDYNIINADDPFGRVLISRLRSNKTKLLTYGLKNTADFYPENIEYHIDHTVYTLNTPRGSIQIRVNLPGEIYVYNSLAAIAAAYCNQISLKQIADGINSVRSISGRLEVVYEDQDNRIIVDFAHTEDALEKTIKTIRPFTKGRIILVFGVYADDSEEGRAKRNGMAKIASLHADLSVITTDNPKEQDNQIIIQGIEEGMKFFDGTYKTVVDRREAIEHAISSSSPGDVILITGKGHETSQIIGKDSIPFNDAEIVKQIQANRNKQMVIKSNVLF